MGKLKSRHFVFELKKQRFRFLEKLYEESKANPAMGFPPAEIGEKIGLDVSPEESNDMENYLQSHEYRGIIEYLQTEGLIEIDYGDGPSQELGWANITHNGIKEVEKSRNNPQSSTEHFPPYQIIYNIGGNYSEKGRVMGDEFRDIRNATIINKSLVENSFNKVKREHDEEISKALVEVAKFIEKSGDPVSGALFDKFNEELNKPQPDKSRLKSFWSGIQNALPSIASISDSVAKIVSLFA
jgi:hypothetical protein